MNTPALSYGLDQINISFLEQQSVVPTTTKEKKTLPLVLSPRWDDSLGFLCQFLETNRSWVDAQILAHGAVLLRGFQIDSCPDFERATLALQPALYDRYRGTSPRTSMAGTKFTFSAADVPVNYPIAQHLEMAFLKAIPREVYFGCIQASTKPGGETALCDFRQVYQDISPLLRNKLATKKLKYTRRHSKVGEKYTYDVGAMLGWPQLFQTTDKDQIDALCQQEESAPVQWTGPNKDTFVQEWQDDAWQYHPITNEPVWFNHSQVFHWTSFPAELWFAFWRVKDLRLLLQCLLVSIFVVIKYGLLGYKMALTTEFGDGTPISIWEMSEIRSAIHKNMVFSRWRKGDILCIDNFSTSHGRQPTYDKGRKVVLAWSLLVDKASNRKTQEAASQTQQAAAAVVVPSKNKVQEQALPGLVTVSPDNSPESTLTSTESYHLKESFQFTQEQLATALQQQQLQQPSKSNKGLKRSANSSPDLFHSDSIFWNASK
jgi:alpha-ketoglutarate-dependent taurine dioxygenase